MTSNINLLLKKHQMMTCRSVHLFGYTGRVHKGIELEIRNKDYSQSAPPVVLFGVRGVNKVCHLRLIKLLALDQGQGSLYVNFIMF